MAVICIEGFKIDKMSAFDETDANDLQSNQ